MRRLTCLVCLALFGCSALVEPDPSRLGGGGDGSDAGPVTMRDGGPPPVDGGSQPDAYVPPGEDDAGPGCISGARCEGDTLVRCEDGVETREPCGGAQNCEVDRCVDQICVPGSVACNDDGSALLTCNALGDELTATDCEFGCEASACRDAPLCPGLPTIALGDTVTPNLCATPDANTYRPTAPGDGCGAERRADVGDRTYVLTLAEATDVVIELNDNDGFRAIDTVVYVRRACDDQASQVACSDDVSCAESTLPGRCSGSVFEVRQSRITTRLAAGTYYIIADAFSYRSGTTVYQCGQVQLSVTAAP